MIISKMVSEMGLRDVSTAIFNGELYFCNDFATNLEDAEGIERTLQKQGAKTVVCPAPLGYLIWTASEM